MRNDQPKILLMGLGNCGKTSIFKVIFNHLPPHETIWLDHTTELEAYEVNNTDLLDLIFVDMPGALDWEDREQDKLFFDKAKMLLIVIDAQDEPYDMSINYAVAMIEKAWVVNQNLIIEIFIHKMDGDLLILEQHKDDCQRDITSRLEDFLIDRGISAQMTAHSTSIYDHSMFEAMSKGLQKLVPNLGGIETLLDNLTTTCRFDRVFLFDVSSKCYLAADTAAFDSQLYELFADLIDVALDVSSIYTSPQPAEGTLSMMQLHLVSSSKDHYLLYMRHLDRHLAVIGVVREDAFDRQHLVDHNVDVFRKAIRKFVEIESDKGAL
eukprot:Filipodium_phascolosomae@DN5758_c0_g1_i1.p1